MPAQRVVEPPMEQVIVEDFQPDEGDDPDYKEIDVITIAVNALKTFLKIIWVPILAAAILSVIFIYHEKQRFKPSYSTSATFNIEVVGSSGMVASAYSRSAAERLSRVFPYILQSGALSYLIREDLGVDKLPATISASSSGNTALFTLTAKSSDPNDALNVLESAIENYPKVAKFVVGNTRMTLLGEPSLPTRSTTTLKYDTASRTPACTRWPSALRSR